MAKTEPLLKIEPSLKEDDLGEEWGSHSSAWAHVAGKQSPEIFAHLDIATDGGLKEVNGTKQTDPKKPDFDKLWYNTRYIGAVIVVVFAISNVYFIFKVDYLTITDQLPVAQVPGQNSTNSTQNFLLTEVFQNAVFTLVPALAEAAKSQMGSEGFKLTPTKIIAIVELIFFSVVLLRLAFQAMQAVFAHLMGTVFKCCISEEKQDQMNRLRWYAMADLFWNSIPSICVFSAMRLLYFIVPQILTLHLNSILFYEKEQKFKKLVIFVITRGLAFVVGFDSFLIKYRSASQLIITPTYGFENVLGAVVLLNQILGVVQVSWLIRDRLFRFVFGGEDGIMSKREIVRQNTWEALIAKRIFDKYTRSIDKVVLMLTWCDDDFQMLVLSEETSGATGPSAKSRAIPAPVPAPSTEDEELLGPEWETPDTAWAYVAANPDPVFFKNIAIAEDGGLSDINGTKKTADPHAADFDKLWYGSRYLGAILTVVFAITNVYFIAKLDIDTLDGFLTTAQMPSSSPNSTTEAEEESFTITGIIQNAVFEFFPFFANGAKGEMGSFRLTPTKIVAILELFFLGLLLLWFIRLIAQAIFSHAFSTTFSCCFSKDRADQFTRMRWFAVGQLFWLVIPNLCVFSAIKLLYFIVPQILTLHLNTILFYEKTHKKRKLVFFVITRVMAFIVGFDSFLIKYRAASAYIINPDYSSANIIGAIVLLNQVLGVVQVAPLIRERLYRFVFGGEDGVMTRRETVRQETWEALIAQKVFEKYNALDRIVLMMTWCDDDFQMLVLREDANVGVDKI